jgi:hypothetical protein
MNLIETTIIIRWWVNLLIRDSRKLHWVWKVSWSKKRKSCEAIIHRYIAQLNQLLIFNSRYPQLRVSLLNTWRVLTIHMIYTPPYKVRLMRQKIKTRLKPSMRRKCLGDFWKIYPLLSMWCLIKLNQYAKSYLYLKQVYKSRVKEGCFKVSLKMMNMMIPRSKNTLNNIEL